MENKMGDPNREGNGSIVTKNIIILIIALVC